MKTSELLVEVKKALEVENNRLFGAFVCHAIEAVRQRYERKCKFDLADRLRDIGGDVMDSIFPHYTVSDWVKAEHPGVYKELNRPGGRKDAWYAYRQAWLDDLIREYREKGD